MLASASGVLNGFWLRWANLRKEMSEARAQLEAQAELKALDAKLRIVLPPEYQAHYEDVQPVSMGSAGLKFNSAGNVAWDEIWDSFCDLAMAGGPPHKGKLLEPASQADIDAEPELYSKVVDEICRGIRMVSDLAVERSPNPGWVRVMCSNPVMAGWLARAIAMENVSAHLDGSSFELPAGPRFRIEKEIKNVVTAIAKTHHYFDGHMNPRQVREIGVLFSAGGQPLLQPCRHRIEGVDGMSLQETRACAARQVTERTGLQVGGTAYAGWLGVECPSVQAAIWMMRALVVSNLLTRREDRILYLPVHPVLDPFGNRVSGELEDVHRLARLRGLAPRLVN